MIALLRAAARVRKRWWLFTVAHALIASAIAAAAVIALAGAASWFRRSTIDPWAAPTLQITLGIALLVLAFLILRALRRAPTLVEAAHWLDRHHGLHDRLSTAYRVGSIVPCPRVASDSRRWEASRTAVRAPEPSPVGPVGAP